MSKYKKLTNKQLQYNIKIASNNKTEHPTQEGRDFWVEEEKYYLKEIKRRKENK